MRGKTAAVLAACFISTPAPSAGFLELLEPCKLEAGTCTGYVAGMTDGLLYSTLYEGQVYCFPEGVEVRQVRLVFTSYMQQHPQNLHLPAADLFMRAMGGAFPC